MASRWPLVLIILSTVLLNSLVADGLVGEALLLHLGVGILGTHETDGEQSLLKLQLQSAQRVTKVLIPSSTSIKEGVQHHKGQVVVILARSVKFLGCFLKVTGKFGEVLPSIRGCLPFPDSGLEMIKAGQGRTSNDFDQVHEYNWKWVIIILSTADILG